MIGTIFGRIMVCQCVLVLLLNASSNLHAQSTSETQEESVPERQSQEQPVPFEGWGIPVSPKATKFEETVRNLMRGESRVSVLKLSGEPARRLELKRAGVSQRPIGPTVIVSGQLFIKGRQLKNGQEEEHEMWIYVFEEKQGDSSISTSPLSAAESQLKEKQKSVLREYQLYFDGDSLEQVKTRVSNYGGGIGSK